MMPRLEDKHVVITGASVGIGAALARLLGERRCRVVLAARRTELLEQVAAEVQGNGGEALVVPTDVTDQTAVKHLVDAAVEQFGEIDVWVSNAGGGILHSLLDATEDDMLWQFRLNCLSSLWAYQAVIPTMVHRGAGTVIDINSLGGKAGFAYGGGYVTAKAGMSALGDSMRQELIGTGVRVITVYPGVTETEFVDTRPDRTDGSVIGDGARLRNSGSFLRRTVLKKQTAGEVALAIIRTIESGKPVAYPHRWGALAVLAMNLWPGFSLRMMERLRKRDAQN